MINYAYVLTGVLIMALVTYVVRMLPLVVFRRKITNQFIQSFLAYVPYAVLSAMTFPAILSSTASGWSAAAGLLVAILLAYKDKGLLTVALGATAAVFVVEQGMALAGLPLLIRFFPKSRRPASVWGRDVFFIRMIPAEGNIRL